MSNSSNSPALHLVEDDVLCPGGEYPPLLPPEIKTVDAVCRDVERFHAFHRQNFRLAFWVVEPEEYAGIELYCFAAFRSAWKKRLSIGAKIHQLAVAATGQRRIKTITKSIFVGKMFRCSVRQTGEGETAYSVVDRIVERLTG